MEETEMTKEEFEMFKDLLMLHLKEAREAESEQAKDKKLDALIEIVEKRRGK